MYSIKHIFELDDASVTSCIVPYIKKEWITGVYTFSYGLKGDLLVLQANESVTELNLYTALNHDEQSGNVSNTTHLVTKKEYDVYETLARYNTFNSWFCKDEFDRHLFLDFISKTVLAQQDDVAQYDKLIDEKDIHNSMLLIIREAFNNL